MEEIIAALHSLCLSAEGSSGEQTQN